MHPRLTLINRIVFAFILCSSVAQASVWHRLASNAKKDLMAASSSERSKSCSEKYGKIYGDDTLNITLGLGYADMKPRDGVMDAYIMDALIDTITEPCAAGINACGFKDGPAGTNSFYKWVTGPNKKRHFVVLKFLSGSLTLDDKLNRTGSKKLQDENCRIASEQYNNSIAAGDEVVFYLGHSRDGGGPDFCPALVKGNNHVNYDHYRSNQSQLKSVVNALKKSVAQKHSPELIGMFSCSSKPHFYESLRSVSPQTSFIMTAVSLSFAKVFRETIVSLDSVLGMRCGNDFKNILGPETSINRF